MLGIFIGVKVKKSLKNFMAVTLALFGFMIGKACTEEPKPDLEAQNKLFGKKTAREANRGIKRAINPKALKRLDRKFAAKAIKDPRYKVVINDNAPYKGEKNALITIVEFSDFQCPFCRRVEPTIDRIMNTYKGQVKVVWMNNPLGFHKNAMPAAEVAYTIFKLKGNDAFWKVHKKFFDNQRKLGEELYKEVAKEVGVDWAKIDESLKKHTYQGIIKAQQAQGVKLGARGTPAFFINGRFLSGAQPYDNFKRLIDEELKKAQDMVKKGTPKSKIYDTIMKNAEKSVK